MVDWQADSPDEREGHRLERNVKVAVIGYAGSGKSTFARRLGDALCIRVKAVGDLML